MAVTNAQIYEKLGELSESQRNATASRKVMHERMDKTDVLLSETVNTLSKVQFALQVTTDVAVQTRDRLQQVEETLATKISPAIETHSTFQADAEPLIKLLKNIRLGLWALVGLMGVMGVSFVSLMSFFHDTARDAFRWWLGI
jgi:hypothetical protein